MTTSDDIEKILARTDVLREMGDAAVPSSRDYVAQNADEFRWVLNENFNHLDERL